ncbi:MAG TPA: EMC3/TMCO1 family protein [Thermoplasmata archaeon]|nr:EMC3/TMCO1 family protein [Thermoplasmata archaeon]
MADEAAEKVAKPEPRPRPTPRQSFQRFIMIFLGILAIYVLIFPDVGRTFGQVAGAILEPVIGFDGRTPVITILLAGLVTTTASSVLRHIFTPWMRMAKMNATLASIRKEQMEAFRKQKTNRVQKLRAKQSEIMVEYQDVQFVPLKLMAYTMFFFVVIFTWLRLIFVDQTLATQGNLYFAVPWSFNAHLLAVYVFPSWILLYSLLAIPFGQVVQRVLKYISFRRKLQALGEITETSPPEDEAYERPAEAAADDPPEDEEAEPEASPDEEEPDDEGTDADEEADEGEEESAGEDTPEDEDDK